MVDRDRVVVSDAMWAKVAMRLPGKVSDRGVTARGNRRFLEAVLRPVRTGLPWRDLPSDTNRPCDGLMEDKRRRQEASGGSGHWPRSPRVILLRRWPCPSVKGKAGWYDFGNWNSVFQRFRRWALAGVVDRISERLPGEPDFEYAVIFATIVCVQQKASGAKGGLKIRPLAARAAA